MPVFVIPDVLPLNKIPPHQGLFLLILNAGKKPPHIAIVINGKVYSLTYKDRQIGEAVNILMKSIHLKLIKTLLFQLTLPPGFTLTGIFQTMEKSLMAYEKAEAGKVSCLAPLKAFFNRAYDVNVQKVEYVFDLLPLLYDNKIISAVYHLNMDNETKERKYFFQTYTMDEVNANIIKLNQNIII